MKSFLVRRLQGSCSHAGTPAFRLRQPPRLAEAGGVLRPPGASGQPLCRHRDGISAVHGLEASGFRLLERNADGLLWRLVLIDSATHSLDLQYYVWFGDATGQLLIARVIAAADRGVKVRILFDDLNTMLHDMTSPELRDADAGTHRQASEHRDPRLQRLA